MRLRELDALRGLAALSVVTYHALQTLPGLGGWLWHPPLNNGREAVVLFFVLSGFVLNLPFLKRLESPLVGYGAFLIKRVCRLYLPYLVALVTSVALMLRFGGPMVPGTSAWVNEAWHGGFSLAAFLLHLNLLSTLALNSINPVIWSLVVEARVSLLFPLLALIVNRLPWALALVAMLGIEVANVALEGPLTRLLGYPNDYCWTFHYTTLFAIGMVAARFYTNLVATFRHLALPLRVGVLLAGLACYYRHRTLYDYLPAAAHEWAASHGLPGLFSDWRIEEPIMAIGVVCLIVVALSSKRASGILKLPPFQFLGEVSYSLYLYHAVLLLSLHHLLAGVAPPWVAVVAIFPVSFAVAWLSWLWIEVPAIRLGSRLTRVDPDKGRGTGREARQ